MAWGGLRTARELGGAIYSRGESSGRRGRRWHAAGDVFARQRRRSVGRRGQGPREGDGEDQDEQQRLTETSKARGQEEDADTGEEEDELTGTHCSSVGTARRRR